MFWPFKEFIQLYLEGGILARFAEFFKEKENERAKVIMGKRTIEQDQEA